ncbi:hypothetical protein J416_09814 [Gracilibacillus halophilus YIM-C55.5]|uniref:Integral membrane protein n=1 Tax=Gracilibacillus halophilus YIM-C55.5 TaxID=1308866 RepID=N4WKI1_9BACI|nr:DUF2269 family protein [Gracilibacillus halophilus]ENH96662.1 hypothetical protein J416_09814 [Gracilibacillus halophilus YIM-C55.5]
MYETLVIVHIFSAIIGVGPGFILTTIVKSAQTINEIQFAFFLKRKVHNIVISGGSFMLLTGIAMGILKPRLFQEGWYLLSLVLYSISFLMGPTVLKQYTKPIKELLAQQPEEIPTVYHEYIKKLLIAEYIVNTLLIIIILLMITKPL